MRVDSNRESSKGERTIKSALLGILLQILKILFARVIMWLTKQVRHS